MLKKSKGNRFHQQGFIFQSLSDQFNICLTPYRKASITGAFFIQESEDDMGVRVVFPDMGKDPSVQLIEKTITQNGTYDAITDGANGYSKVNVNVGGGGGSSDFSTAEVTVNVEGYSAGMPKYGIWNSVHIVDDGLDGALDGALTIPFPIGYSNPISAVLYKGKAEWQINAGSAKIPIVSVEGTGSIEVSEYSGDYFISITGDCSITVNYGTSN